MFNLRTFYEKCIRVWYLLKKPSSKEFKSISKISALGVVLIGLIGFLISLAMNIFI